MDALWESGRPDLAKCGSTNIPLYAAQMVCCSDLPEHLIAAILRMAFQDSGRALAQWVRMGLVCRRAMHPSRCPAHIPATC